MVKMRERIAWALAAALGLLVLASLTGVVSGGPLDPPGPPGSTMRPISDLPPAWSDALDSTDGAPGPNPPAGCNSSRVKCVLGDEAVLDRETGLVWQRDPFSYWGGKATWTVAWTVCQVGFIGSPERSGWRLPSIEELRSLYTGPAVPPNLSTGNPFVGIQTDDMYWTSTSVDASTVRVMDFIGNSGQDNRAVTDHVWCVRGGKGADAIP